MQSSPTTLPSNDRPRPVLMIPLRRCGSHALRLRLNFNKDFYSPYPLHLVDFMPLVDLYGDLSNDYAYFQMVIDLVGLQAATMVKWDGVALDPVAIFHAIKDRPRSVHAVMWEMLFQAGRVHGAKVVMDKSLDNVHYADELMPLFEDMLFLNVVRDPRAQVASMNRAIIHDFSTLLNARTWVKAHELARTLAKQNPSRVLTIRYEDFLSNQEAVLRKVCQFLGIAYLPEMLDITRSEEAQRISTMSALWETNSSSPVLANIDKFKKTLTEEEIAEIETLAGELMDYYGYERATRGGVEITSERVDRAVKESDARRADAWAELRRRDPMDYQLRKLRARYLAMVKDGLTREPVAREAA